MIPPPFEIIKFLSSWLTTLALCKHALDHFDKGVTVAMVRTEQSID